MSRNFELMQEMETGQALPSAGTVEPAFSFPRRKAVTGTVVAEGQTMEL